MTQRYKHSSCSYDLSPIYIIPWGTQLVVDCSSLLLLLLLLRGAAAAAASNEADDNQEEARTRYRTKFVVIVANELTELFAMIMTMY